MKAVFADAFYFVALLNRADQHHSKAAAAARDFRNNLVTTEWVLAEVADAFAASPSRRLAAAFICDLSQDPKVKIIPATTDLFQRGLQLYEKRPDKQWSLTDCISFVTMQDENLTDALTGDEHFVQAGFKAMLR
jgi:predicted nucleic acid-binding protein